MLVESELDQTGGSGQVAESKSNVLCIFIKISHYNEQQHYPNLTFLELWSAISFSINSIPIKERTFG